MRGVYERYFKIRTPWLQKLSSFSKDLVECLSKSSLASPSTNSIRFCDTPYYFHPIFCITHTTQNNNKQLSNHLLADVNPLTDFLTLLLLLWISLSRRTATNKQTKSKRIRFVTPYYPPNSKKFQNSIQSLHSTGHWRNYFFIKLNLVNNEVLVRHSLYLYLSLSIKNFEWLSLCVYMTLICL